MEPSPSVPAAGYDNDERIQTMNHEDTTFKMLPVRVLARARPLLPAETVQSNRSCLAFDAGGKTLVLGKDRAFTFDAVYPPSSSQQSMYNEWVEPLVAGCFRGYNATVLAYGQTGAGKTFTMGSGDNTTKDPEVRPAWLIPDAYIVDTVLAGKCLLVFFSADTRLQSFP
jgi:hypothetical protein